MKIDLNGHAIDLTAVDAQNDKFFLANLKDFRAVPRHVYFWDCTRRASAPKTRPAEWVCDADALFLIDDSMWHYYGIHGQRARLEKEAWEHARKALGVKTAQGMQDAINKVFPPQKIKIPYDKLVDPHVPDMSVVLAITETYVRWRATYASNPGAPFFIQVPVSYQFSSRITHVCKGEATAIYDPPRHSGGKFELSKQTKELIKEHGEAVAEDRKFREENKDRFGDW